MSFVNVSPLLLIATFFDNAPVDGGLLRNVTVSETCAVVMFFTDLAAASDLALAFD